MYYVLVPIFTSITFLSALCGAFFFIDGMVHARTDTQEAAAAVGVAFALIPFVILRCAHIEAKRGHEKRLLDAMERVAQWTRE